MSVFHFNFRNNWSMFMKFGIKRMSLENTQRRTLYVHINNTKMSDSLLCEIAATPGPVKLDLVMDGLDVFKVKANSCTATRGPIYLRVFTRILSLNTIQTRARLIHTAFPS
jgi:hypothetical protein